MTGEQKNIDKLFRDRLNGLREKPPVHAWTRLDNALNASVFSKRLFYFRLAAASVLIFLAFGAGYYFALYQNNPSLTDNPGISEQLPPQNQGNEPGTSGLQSGPSETTSSTGGEQAKTITTPPEEETTFMTADGSDNSGIPGEVAGNNRTVAVAGGMEEAPDNPMADQRGSTPNSVITMAFIDVGELEILREDALGVINSAKEQSTAPMLLGYEDILPYDFEYNPPKKNKTLALGAHFAPVYSYREISPDYGSGTAASSRSAEDNYNNAEDALHSYAGGLNVDYNFSGNWSFQSGMYYSRIGQVSNDALQFQQNNAEFILAAINTSTGNIDVAIERVPENVKKITPPKDSVNFAGVEGVRIVQNFDLFEIPFLVRYKVLNKKFSILFSGGLSPAYLADNSTYLEYEGQKYNVGNSDNLNNMIVNTSLGLGLEYLITKQLSVNFEPTFKYSLSPLNNNSYFSYHPYYFSWFTGIRLKIN